MVGVAGISVPPVLVLLGHGGLARDARAYMALMAYVRVDSKREMREQSMQSFSRSAECAE